MVKRYVYGIDQGSFFCKEAADGPMVAWSDFDAIAAELASAYDTLDYFGHSPPYDGSQAKAHEARIRELEAALGEAKEIVKVFHDMGTPKHVREELWALYQQSPEMKRLNAALAGQPSETPVSTLCAVCDQIKELHPNTHEWTAKETACDAECRCGHPKAAHVASTFTNCDHCSCIDYEPDRKGQP